MERYIAVDNVCAWPNLTKTPDGTIVATIFNQPTHGGWEGDVECWASMDGRLWRLQGVPAPHEPATNRMNVAAGMARDGSLVVLASGWSKRTPMGQYTNPHTGSILPIWICRSGDNGKNWQRDEMKTSKLVPFGDIVQLADGDLGVCIYTEVSEKKHASFFYKSSDDGRIWKKQSVISEGINESTPVVLFSSSDHGKTWKKKGSLTLGGQHPAHLLLLKNNSVLLSYGIRNRGLYGVGVRISSDSGETWSSPEVLVTFETDRRSVDGGYPSTVQTDEGTLVTAYYCSGITTHFRYHMGVVRWKPEV